MEATTGQEVAQAGAVGAEKPGQILLAGLARGFSGLIDVEIARRTQTPDRADIEAAARRTQPKTTALTDTLKSLGPLQIGGLVVVGVLTVGLFAGWFR